MKKFIYLMTGLALVTAGQNVSAKELDLDQYLPLGKIIAPLESASAEFKVNLKLKNMEIPDALNPRNAKSGSIQVLQTTKTEVAALKVELPFDGSITKNANIESLEKRLAEYEAKIQFCQAELVAMHEQACGKSFFRASCERQFKYVPTQACAEDFKPAMQALAQELKVLQEQRESTFCYFMLPSKASEVDLLSKGQKTELKAVLNEGDGSLSFADRNLTLNLKTKDGSVRQAVIVCDKNVSLRMLQDGFANRGIQINWAKSIELKPNFPSVEKIELLDSPNIEPIKMPEPLSAPAAEGEATNLN